MTPAIAFRQLALTAHGVHSRMGTAIRAAAACAAVGASLLAPAPASALTSGAIVPRPSLDTAAHSAADTAALVIDNRRIITFRAPIGALSPAERATAAAKRIGALAEQRAGDSIAVQRIAEGRLVLVGSRSVFTVSPADLDTLRGETLDETTTLAVARLRDALQSERESRSFIHLLTGLGLAVLATIVFVFALRLLRRTRAFALTTLPEVAGPRLPRLAIGTFTLLTADQLLAFCRRFVRLVTWGTELVAAYVWLAYVLTRFAYSRPWGEALGTYLVTTVKGFALTALGAVPGLFIVALIFVVTRWISRLVSALFDAVSAGTVQLSWVDREVAMPTKRIAIALLWLFAIVAAYPYVPGSGTQVFKGISVFLGLMISIGSSGLVNQTMSGLVLIYSRALRPGDYVRVGEIEGTVTALGMLSTKIRTICLEEITLPNAVVVSSDIKNFSRLASDQGVIVHTSVTIGYNTPWRQVQAMLLMAAARTTGLRPEPAPFVLQTALSDFYIEYQLNVYLADPEQRIPVLSRLHANIVDSFNEHGVQIMSPHYEDDPETPAVVPPEQWYAEPARREVRRESVSEGVGVRVSGVADTPGDYEPPEGVLHPTP